MTQIRSNSISAILKRRAGFIATLTVLGAGASAFALMSAPPLFTAKAQILFDSASEQTLHTHIEALHSTFGSSPEENKVLNIHPAGRASVLNLKYTGQNAEQAARLLNALAKSYIAKLSKEPLNNNDPKTLEFLQTLKTNIETAQTALETFEAKATKHARTPSIKTHEAYEAAKISLLKAQKDITPFLKKDGNFTLNPNAPAIRNSNAIQNLLEKQRALKQDRAQLGVRYGDKHPDMKALAAGLTLIDKQITAESEAILEVLKTNYALVKSEIKNLEERGMQASLEEEAARYKQSQEKLDTLKSRLTEAKNLYETFLSVHNKAITTNGNRASLLTPATPPARPSFPNIPLLTILAALLSALIASLVAITQERRRAGFTSARQIEETIDLQCFGLIPKAIPDKKRAIADFVLDNPSNQTSEAIRALKLNIKLQAESTETECKVISLTSTLAGEGKTTLAAWIARLSAKSGQRVILIDADLRRPSIHLALGQRNKNTLADYLSGTKKLEETINTSDPSGLHVIYGRSVPNSALDMISSEKMDALIRNLRGTYDLVIIDTPASMAVPDARALEKRSDLFLYCIAWNKTPRDLIHNGIAQFKKFGNPTIASVLTQIDPQKHVQLGYGSSENEYTPYKDA